MPRPASILAVVSTPELGDFLPDSLVAEVRSLTGRFDHLDTANLTVSAFHAELMVRNPEILIACWSTPPLPGILPSKLRYVCYLTGSVRRVIRRRHIEDCLLVTNWGGSISRIVAEWALFHVLACLRRATFWSFTMHRDGGWKNGVTQTA